MFKAKEEYKTDGQIKKRKKRKTKIENEENRRSCSLRKVIQFGGA